MRLKDIFKEFKDLYYSIPNVSNLVDFKDIYFGNLMILRITKYEYKIYYLKDGVFITIPWSWIDLFSSLNTHSGEKILYSGINEDSDDIDKFIYYFLNLIISFYSNNDSKFFKVNEYLLKILELGTNNFINWFNELYIDEKINNHFLKPIEYNSLEKFKLI